jgi:hypothetical protein
MDSMDSGSFGDVTDPNIAILMGTLSFRPLGFGATHGHPISGQSHLSTPPAGVLEDDDP